MQHRPMGGRAAPEESPSEDHLRTAIDPDVRPDLHDDLHDARPLDGALRVAVDTDVRPDLHHARPVDGALRVAVDFDGVLFDHVPYLLRGFRDAHGIDLEDEGLRYWDFFQYRAVRAKNLTWNCVRNVLAAIDTDPLLHTAAPRDAYAAVVMRRWLDAGHRVEVVTAREEAARSTTEAFLRYNGIPHDALVMNASRKTGYDVLVDDAPHNVLMAAADGGLALLMDQPYNRDVPTKRNPVRVRTWRDVERVVATAPRAAAHA